MGRIKILKHAGRAVVTGEPMPSHACEHHGNGDQHACGARCPYVSPEDEYQDRDDEFAAGDAEQARDCTDQQAGKDGGSDAQSKVMGQRGPGSTVEQRFDREQSGL